MTELTIVLCAITLVLGGFVSGMSYMLIRNLTDKLSYYQRREAEIQSIVERRMYGEDNE